jgi:biopolymer transport protein ExbD
VPGANREDALIVSIDRTGGFYFGPNRLPEKNLADVLRENLTKDVERRVFFCADRRAKYRDVELALDAVRRAGIENVTFLTSQSANEPSK